MAKRGQSAAFLKRLRRKHRIGEFSPKRKRNGRRRRSKKAARGKRMLVHLTNKMPRYNPYDFLKPKDGSWDFWQYYWDVWLEHGVDLGYASPNFASSAPYAPPRRSGGSSSTSYA